MPFSRPCRGNRKIWQLFIRQFLTFLQEICGYLIAELIIADIILQLLSYVAQTEREFIRQRQAEGIAAAKARGVQFERRAMTRPDAYARIKKAWMTGEKSARQAAKALNVAPNTFLKWTHEDYCLRNDA